MPRLTGKGGSRSAEIATGHARYCEVLDPYAPGHDPAHAAAMAASMRGEPLPSSGLPPAELARLAVLVNRCRVREPLRCGCTDRRALCWRSGSPLERAWGQCVECVRGPA